ncbi:hypothetical protein PMAYCL1PPCAC_10927 [Pristionchus mayeri]|uniref:Carboxylesterase type B domain-containing protein n=1 Tax=Pristionchus mayeri TaxID=1317129 RepID=A0AAN4ZGF6_9BILA|nr:hypothetical protein PMAYCL1PPCAC_10927 [Pristionchus mayeri]
MFQSSVYRLSSIQIDDLSKGWPSREDCLYLNVFCPGDTSSNHPVMVFIHGGAHSVGYAHQYGDRGICDGLVRRGVIVVIMQY